MLKEIQRDNDVPNVKDNCISYLMRQSFHIYKKPVRETLKKIKNEGFMFKEPFFFLLKLPWREAITRLYFCMLEKIGSVAQSPVLSEHRIQCYDKNSH